jgi:hypothetical protein
MIYEVEGKLISSELFEKEFVCNLIACKGSCCVEGESGAPLTLDEVDQLEEEYDNIKEYLTEDGKRIIDKEGVFYMDWENEPVTTIVRGKDCTFITYNEQGIALCGIEKAQREGKTHISKPLSCALYPIRVSSVGGQEVLNYHRWQICSPACDNGKELGVKVYKFLEGPLTKAYGKEFFSALEILNTEIERQKSI